MRVRILMFLSRIFRRMSDFFGNRAMKIIRNKQKGHVMVQERHRGRPNERRGHLTRD